MKAILGIIPLLALDNAGIKHVMFSSNGTDHEWQTWRRSLNDIAPRLFED